MDAYSTENWADLYVAVAGASAALAGLIFVSMSINIDRIVTSAQLTSRAAEFITVLVSVLLVSVLMLVPGQGHRLLGAELLGLGFLLTTFVGALLLRRPRRADSPWHWTLVPVVISLFASVPLVIGGLSEFLGAGGGLFWLVPLIVFGFAGSVYNAWVLLVEMLR